MWIELDTAVDLANDETDEPWGPAVHRAVRVDDAAVAVWSVGLGHVDHGLTLTDQRQRILRYGKEGLDHRQTGPVSHTAQLPP